MNIQNDLPDESDTSDEDYDPGIKEDEVSEIDSDGDVEEPLSDNEELKCKSRRVKKRKSKIKKQSHNTVNESKENEEQVEVNEVEKKKKDDDLWADFMKDTGFVSKNNSNSNSNCNTNKSNGNICSKNNMVNEKTTTQKHIEKIKVKQIFEFAGEEVEVEKEVPSNSLEATFLHNSSNGAKRGKRAAGLSGIGNIISQLTKKPKISTLEKTKLDWDRFKKEENLEEELRTHNKGKDG